MSDPNTFTVGWICAIPTESVAARQFLDEEYDLPTCVSPNDNNTYTLGRIGQHRVVIAVLPDGEYGTTSAATVARDMVHSFPNIRVGLMVGIGGGAPSKKHDIRLGDVVVSSPRGGQAGILQYDFGKAIQGQGFHHTGLLNQPQLALRTAVTDLQSRYLADGNQIHENIQAILARKKRLQRSHQRPDLSTDRLYTSSFIHADSSRSCDEICTGDEACDVITSETLIHRNERKDEDDNPAIHYGLIASSNTLMKNAEIRDSFATNHGVLCFEMEAAGLMNHFPCLVIRGICDYSDTHKNKDWQGYAAMTAAAYAKDLLSRIIPTKIEAEKRLSETLSSMNQEIKGDRALNIQSKIHTWLCPPDPSTNYHKALAQRHKGSGQWFIRSCTYLAWKEGRNKTLWIRGIPGCGKTILTSTIIKDLEEGDTCQKPLYFYFDFSDVGKQTFDNMVRSLILQFSHIGVAAKAELQTLHEQHGSGTQQPGTHALERTLGKMISTSPQTPIIIDALDECTAREPLLKWLRDASCRVLLTSRGLEDISRALEGWIDNSCIVEAQGSEVDNDIAAYVQHQLQNPDSTLAETWQSRPDILDKIENKLKICANGMFRWAACQLKALETYEMPNDLLQALDSLPKTLSETYKRILDSVPEPDLKHSKRLLTFLTYSQRPLNISEAVDVLATTFQETPEFHPDYRMPCPERVLKFCSSLVTLTGKDQGIRLAHFSVKEYLISNEDKGRFSHAFEPSVAHGSITEVLMAYISSVGHDEDSTVPFPRYSFPLKWREYLYSRIKYQKETMIFRSRMERKFPFLKYAADHWVHHAEYLSETSKSAHQCIARFLSNRKAWQLVQWFSPQEPADTSIRTVFELQPLYVVCLRGLHHTAPYLLKQGADINAAGGRLGPPLRAACCMGHRETAKLLIEWGAEVDIRDIRHEYLGVGTALMPAIMNRMTDVVDMLLERGADPNLPSKAKLSFDHQDRHPLLAASSIGCVKIVSALLNHGVNVNYTHPYKANALMQACYGGHTAVARLLIDCGATINSLVDRFHPAHPENLLFVHPVEKRCTALILACYAGHVETVELLINRADIDRSWGYNTALNAARFQRRKTVVQTLLKHGAITTSTDIGEDLRRLFEYPLM